MGRNMFLIREGGLEGADWSGGRMGGLDRRIGSILLRLSKVAMFMRLD